MNDMNFWTPQTLEQLEMLFLAFGLCALIGFERQFRQKAAGFRTHVLVGTGAAGFTLVSAYGFAPLIGEQGVQDPSRIAAQIVTGIGFIGAGVIFTRRDVVRGLTTAATIWIAAAIGMAAGAGLPTVAIAVTAIHLFTLTVVGPIVAKLPTRDSRRVLRIVYEDGRGTLSHMLKSATEAGLSAYVLGAKHIPEASLIEITIRFKGRTPLSTIIPQIQRLDGVHEVSIHHDLSDEEEAALP